MTVRLARAFLRGMCVLALTASAAAQVFTGRVDVSIADATGSILPGVTVELTGPHHATAVTDERGEARFLNLPPGTYTVTAKLSGFADYVNRNVPVAVGSSSPLRITLGVGGVAQTVDVTAETPVIDPKRTTTATNVTHEELQQIPSARDPWVVLQTVPGVIVDRVNVGGGESGQQSNFQAKGAAGGENTWNIDGVSITDMSALGSSSAYYDFDMFQEMQVTTGGADASTATPGVSMNFTLKSGSNTPRGSARIYYEDESMQANNLPDDLKATLGGKTGKGNRINKYQDHGGELGGPLWRDRLWAWGAIGRTNVTLLTLASTPDQTILENYSFKGTGQASKAVRGSFTYYRGEKLKYGRDAGPKRPPETTFDQGGPTQLYKGEANVVLGNNLFLTARQSYVEGGFFLDPQGGLDVNAIFADDAGVAHNSYFRFETVRPQWGSSVDGNYFRGRHEIKFGFGYRKADVDSTYTIPGDGIRTFHDKYPVMIADVTAWNDFSATTGRYLSAYLGDTLTFDRLTLNLAARWDRQSSSVRAISQQGNPILPDLLPDLTGNAFDDAVVWNRVTPRAGLTYALTADRRTIARASYAMFASQMNAGQGGFLSTVARRGVLFYGVIDLNGNRVADPEELAGRTCSETSSSADCGAYGFSLRNPANVDEPIHIVGDYRTPTTHEVTLGADRELFRNFGVSATFTWRKYVNFNWTPVQGLRSDDYEERGAVTLAHPAIGSVNVPYYGVKPANFPMDRAATEYVDREGYSQRFWGIEASATKRLSNRWMARLGFSTNDHREYFDGTNARTDPTPTNGNPNVDGGLVMRQTGGSGKSGIYMVLPKYQLIATGLYQAPWGINLAGSMLTRQGYATPYFRGSFQTGDPLTNQKNVLLVSDVGENRLPSVTSLDLRVGKEIAVRRVRFNLDLDVFNALNSGTILGREYDLNLTTADNVLEIMPPRILRLGLRVNF